jgi:hypothetical protein
MDHYDRHGDDMMMMRDDRGMGMGMGRGGYRDRRYYTPLHLIKNPDTTVYWIFAPYIMRQYMIINVVCCKLVLVSH